MRPYGKWEAPEIRSFYILELFGDPERFLPVPLLAASTPHILR